MKKTATKNRDAHRTTPPAETDARNSEGGDFAAGLDRLARYLTVRDHSRLELTTKLGRHFPAQLVDSLIQEAERRHWLAPEDEIARRLALALAKRHKSQMYIEGQLRQRGLPLAEVSINEAEIIRQLIERKFGVHALTQEQKDKAYRFLRYRGFTEDAVRQVLNEER